MTPSVADLPAPTRRFLDRLKPDAASLFAGGSQTHKNLFLAHAPGQLDVLGGETASIGGLSCTYPIGIGAIVAVQRRDDQKIILRNAPVESSPAGAENAIELSLGDFYGTAALLPQETLRRLFSAPWQWAAYVAGAFPILARHKKLTRRATGANIVCTFAPELAPLGAYAALAGAALCAIAAAYHLILEPTEIAQLAERVQHQIAGDTRGEIANHLAAVLGKENHLLVVKSQPHEITSQVALPKSLRLYAVVLAADEVASPLAGPAASAEVAQRIISRMYRDLGIRKDPTGGYLANVSPALYRRYFRGMLPEQIAGREFLAEFQPEGDPEIHPEETYAPRAAADQQFAEIERVGRFVEALRQLATIRDVREIRQGGVEAGLILADSQAERSARGRHSDAVSGLLEAVAKRGPAEGLLGARAARTPAGSVLAVLADASEGARAALEESVRSHAGALLVAGSHPGAAEGTPVKVPLAAVQ